MAAAASAPALPAAARAAAPAAAHPDEPRSDSRLLEEGEWGKGGSEGEVGWDPPPPRLPYGPH